MSKFAQALAAAGLREAPSSGVLVRRVEVRPGEKKIGSQPSAISAASATLFGPIAAM